LALSGAVAHHDSAGNSGEIGPGDVQWMTAGSGVLHKEYHSEEFAESGGIFQMLQLWVNLPKVHKMHPPRYQGLKGADMPKVRITDDSALTLVAGSFEGKNGPAKTFSPLSFFVLDLAAGDSFEATYPSTWNTAYLITKGTLQVNEAQRAEAEDLCLFENADGSIHVQALENAQVVILSGEQIDEPVAHYGPFVMNTVEELQEAVADFQSGKFGSLE
jgi:redox-sensitive bicupin YhaK (pirin superfamily)